MMIEMAQQRLLFSLQYSMGVRLFSYRVYMQFDFIESGTTWRTTFLQEGFDDGYGCYISNPVPPKIPKNYFQVVFGYDYVCACILYFRIH